MKEWLTAREIAEEALTDMPATERAVRDMAERKGWNDQPHHARPREGKGGGTEYHIALLPTLAQIAYKQKHMKADLLVFTEPKVSAPDVSLSDRAQRERDARLLVVKEFDKFRRGLNLSHAQLVQIFTDKYNAGTLQVDAWVRELVPSVSKRSLIRWRSVKREGKAGELAFDRSQSRSGTGVIDLANGGDLRAFVLGLLANTPHISAKNVRKVCRDKFGDTIRVVSKGVERRLEMPPVRTFQHAMKALKERHHVELTKLTNPDLFRSHMALSGSGSLRHITKPNQLWQIDASPIDALCTDGRHSVYVCIDLATRRMTLSVSKTPRASAVAALIRKAIIAWGVPDVIKTDNGSDFTARDTQRLFASLDVEADVSDAYSPEQKGHVERAIKTFQHDCASLLPGFVGHNVAERRVIEERKSFAQRLGQTERETFGVKLSGSEMQRLMDDWANITYANAPHAGLGGKSPFIMASQAHYQRRDVDVRALDLLVMPVAEGGGYRTVTKMGVRIGGNYYLAPRVMPGTKVHVRHDEHDMGRILLFDAQTHAFLQDGVCPHLSGVDPAALVALAKAEQSDMLKAATRDIRKKAQEIAKGRSMIERVLDVDRRDAPNVVHLPRPSVQHTTPQIEAAIEAMSEQDYRAPVASDAVRDAQRKMIEEMSAEERAAEGRAALQAADAMITDRLQQIAQERLAGLPENVVVMKETAKERYCRAVRAMRAAEAGEQIDPAIAMWVGGYCETSEYRGQAVVHEQFGDEWLFGS